MKPYFVELTITAVVMAGSEIDAMIAAEREASEIVRDGELSAGTAIEVTSLEHLQRLDPEWTGGCIPYLGDGNTTLSKLLPEVSPFVDTQTRDLFANASPSN